MSTLLSTISPSMRVCIKGKEDEEAFLTTKTRTYSLKHVDTSNTLLLVSGASDPHLTITSTHKSFLELRRTMAKIDRVETLIHQNPLHFEKKGAGNTYSLYELESIVPASPKELIQALDSLGAFEFEEKWRILAPDSEFEIVNEMVEVCKAEGWNGDKVPVKKCKERLEALGCFPVVVIQHILRTFCEGKGDEVKISSKRVIPIFARKLLEEKEGTMLKKKLMEALEDKLLDGMDASFEYLRVSYASFLRFVIIFTRDSCWRGKEEIW